MKNKHRINKEDIGQLNNTTIDAEKYIPNDLIPQDSSSQNKSANIINFYSESKEEDIVSTFINDYIDSRKKESSLEEDYISSKPFIDDLSINEIDRNSSYSLMKEIEKGEQQKTYFSLSDETNGNINESISKIDRYLHSDNNENLSEEISAETKNFSKCEENNRETVSAVGSKSKDKFKTYEVPVKSKTDEAPKIKSNSTDDYKKTRTDSKDIKKFGSGLKMVKEAKIDGYYGTKPLSVTKAIDNEYHSISNESCKTFQKSQNSIVNEVGQPIEGICIDALALNYKLGVLNSSTDLVCNKSQIPNTIHVKTYCDSQLRTTTISALDDNTDYSMTDSSFSNEIRNIESYNDRLKSTDQLINYKDISYLEDSTEESPVEKGFGLKRLLRMIFCCF